MRDSARKGFHCCTFHQNWHAHFSSQLFGVLPRLVNQNNTLISFNCRLVKKKSMRHPPCTTVIGSCLVYDSTRILQKLRTSGEGMTPLPALSMSLPHRGGSCRGRKAQSLHASLESKGVLVLLVLDVAFVLRLQTARHLHMCMAPQNAC